MWIQLPFTRRQSRKLHKKGSHEKEIKLAETKPLTAALVEEEERRRRRVVKSAGAEEWRRGEDARDRRREEARRKRDSGREV